ncbi:MAG TPA: CoA transferase [Acidobacteriota bacterium]|nr:CoA transferase [Acidobacteriota bacterium]
MQSNRKKTKTLLDGIAVLDAADERGNFAAKLLADLGATVIKLEFSGRNRSPGCLSYFYDNSNKQSVNVKPRSREGKLLLCRLIEKADILIETGASGPLAALYPDNGLIRRANPRLIHIAISGFGRTGPLRDIPYDDHTIAAAGGQTYITRDSSGRPGGMFFRQSYATAALFAANAALLGLRKRKITGKGMYLDLSVQEAVASMLDPIMIDYFRNGEITGGKTDQTGSAFNLLPCSDGFIQATVFRNWETVLELMKSEGKAGRLTAPEWQDAGYRERHRARVIETAAAWSSTHAGDELFHLAQAMRFPWAPVALRGEIRKSRQLQSRRFFIAASLPGRGATRSAVFPGRPYKISGSALPPFAPAPMPGKHIRRIIESLASGNAGRIDIADDPGNGGISNGRILNGIRVLDLTRMLSGPYATRLLGDFGADVIKVQSGKTALGAEHNDSAYFRAWNRNKRSVCLNLDHPEARDVFLRLVSISDVVVENFSPRVMDNWGLSYRQLKKVKPDLIMASISFMGQTGPWRDYVGYAPTFHALSGLMARTDSIITIGNSFGDMVAGLYAVMTILAAIHDREHTGRGRHIDVSAYESLCAMLGPAVANVSSSPDDGAVDVPRDDYRDGQAGCYPCKGIDRWCVIRIGSDIEWRAFRGVCARPELNSAKFASPRARQKHFSELAEVIARWTSRRRAETVVHRLRKAGLAAAVVSDAADVARDRQLAARRFFIRRSGDEGGNILCDRTPIWPWNEAPSGWKAAPALGQDNRQVYCSLLGYSALEYRRLVKKGVLG